MKDRASEVVVAVAVAHGIKDVIVASTGNAAASLACIAASAGIRATILVPENAPPAKLAQIVAYGASVYRVAGRYDDAYSLARKVSEMRGMFNRSTGINPFTREGKKTCALEIAEQLGWQAPGLGAGPDRGRQYPERGVEGLPGTGGAGTAAVAATARRRPVGGVQRHRQGLRVAAGRLNPGQAQTIADSITVDEPRDRTAALAALSRLRGLAVEVDDHEIIDACPSTCFTFRRFRRAVQRRRLRRLRTAEPSRTVRTRRQRVVCVATGAGLKDLRPVLSPGSDGCCSGGPSG